MSTAKSECQKHEMATAPTKASLASFGEESATELIQAARGQGLEQEIGADFDAAIGRRGLGVGNLGLAYHESDVIRT